MATKANPICGKSVRSCYSKRTKLKCPRSGVDERRAGGGKSCRCGIPMDIDVAPRNSFRKTKQRSKLRFDSGLDVKPMLSSSPRDVQEGTETRRSNWRYRREPWTTEDGNSVDPDKIVARSIFLTRRCVRLL
ncbi:hypothetical protein KM043_007389 [Ampulex compressa]|nr:hypothetical protein KM043_007389 [Ampulex compressa]